MGCPRKERSNCPVCGRKVENLRSHFCSNKCQMEFQYQAYIERWRKGLESGCRGAGSEQLSPHIRRFMREKYGEKCARCGWAERNPWNSLVHLTVDHIDGDFTNAREDNLVLLCSNCHSLTPTFGQLNRGRGRKMRHRGHSSVGERCLGKAEVEGSSPSGSTI